MKLIKGIIGFFTDDLVTAALVVGWIIVAAAVVRMSHPSEVGAAFYLAGVIAILIFGAWRRVKSS